MSNFPPGVTGNEPQIAGDTTWEEWVEALRKGDKCLVSFHGVKLDAYYQDTVGGKVEVLLICAAGTLARAAVSWDDIESPAVANAAL